MAASFADGRLGDFDHRLRERRTVRYDRLNVCSDRVIHFQRRLMNFGLHEKRSSESIDLGFQLHSVNHAYPFDRCNVLRRSERVEIDDRQRTRSVVTEVCKPLSRQDGLQAIYVCLATRQDGGRISAWGSAYKLYGAGADGSGVGAVRPVGPVVPEEETPVVNPTLKPDAKSGSGD